MPTITLDGARLEYEDVPGSDAAAPLLFLHEGLGSVGLWRGFHRRVAELTGRRAVAYSRRGHGWSDPPAAMPGVRFMHEEAASTVPALVAALRLDEPILVGHSDGGSIALLAAAGPLPVTGLVVLAPHVFVEDVGQPSIAALDDRFRAGELARRMARHHADAGLMFGNWARVWRDPGFRTGWDLRPELPEISCPVLAIQGDVDEFGTAVHVEAVRDLATGPVDLRLLHCGHSPHLELPAETAAAITGFVAGLP